MVVNELPLSKRQRAELDAFQHIFVKVEKLEKLEKKIEKLERRIDSLEKTIVRRMKIHQRQKTMVSNYHKQQELMAIIYFKKKGLNHEII